MTNMDEEKDGREVISREEFDQLLREQEAARTHPYYVLRDRSLLCILWKTGKRASEVTSVEMRDVEVDEKSGLLRVTFHVLKKRSRSRLETRRNKAMLLGDP